MSGPTVLGFDTSGAYCGAALFRDGDVVAARHEDMTRGQAERLFPLLEEVLAESGAQWSELHALGTGIGPGNFTGIRISVAASRGLSLSLGIPAVGIPLMDALALDAPVPALLLLKAPRQQHYASVLNTDGLSDPQIYATEDLPTMPNGAACVGEGSQELAPRLGLTAVPAKYAPASAIARLAAQRANADHPPPTPLYLRPADAAPPREAPPTIRP
ncbi:MAG: tRNA (adenosine(37)-N6)-threonylcarbamoyltransferase complex dimerization subunit type 1 TsaB [Pseudomonadota bacterium]